LSTGFKNVPPEVQGAHDTALLNFNYTWDSP
jgi:hypothetical protein